MKLLRFFRYWTFERYLRLLIAILIAIYGIYAGQYALLLISGLLTLFAFLNISCCGSGACNGDSCKRRENDTK